MVISLRYKSIYVPQIDETDCGAACLAMILKNYHSRVSKIISNKVDKFKLAYQPYYFM